MGLIASGGVQSGMVGDSAVTGGNIASGSIDLFKLTSGVLVSGVFNLTSGYVTSGYLGDNAVVSGSIASGQVSRFHLSSGSVLSGAIASGQVGQFHYSSGSVTSGAIASGQIGRNHVASGLVSSGNAGPITAETISGLRAVMINSSGQLQIAMASVSGRMPACGVVVDNQLSGLVVNVITQGFLQSSSGLADFSGHVGGRLFVGRSGQVTTISGSWSSGGFASGDIGQVLAVATNSGGLLVQSTLVYSSGGPLGTNPFAFDL